MFIAAAEESLRQRKAAVVALETLREDATNLRRNGLRHLSHLVVASYPAEDILAEEKASVAARDIFGMNLAASDDIEANPEDYDEEADSPFVMYLKNMAEKTEGAAKFEFWGSGPFYTTCYDQALKIAGGNEKLAESILEGDIPLHEMPKEARSNADPALRQSWLLQRQQEANDVLVAHFGGLGTLLDLNGGNAK